jgi:hypothetical protein
MGRGVYADLEEWTAQQVSNLIEAQWTEFGGAAHLILEL